MTAPSQAESETVRQAIADTDARFAEAFNRGDMTALVARYAEDALLLPPDSPAERGRQAVESGFKELLDAGWKNLSISSVEVGSDGGLAYNVGKYSADVPTKEGASKRVTGKFVDIYRRHADGSWKMHVTIFNSDEPPPGQ